MVQPGHHSKWRLVCCRQVSQITPHNHATRIPLFTPTPAPPPQPTRLEGPLVHPSQSVQHCLPSHAPPPTPPPSTHLEVALVHAGTTQAVPCAAAVQAHQGVVVRKALWWCVQGWEELGI